MFMFMIVLMWVWFAVLSKPNWFVDEFVDESFLLGRPPIPSKPPLSPLYELHFSTEGEEFCIKLLRAMHSKFGSGGAQPQSDRSIPNHARAARVGACAEPGSSSGDVLLHLHGPGSLVMKPQFLQLRMQVPGDVNLYGMGENFESLNDKT